MTSAAASGPPLSMEQHNAVRPEIRHIEAGPGAGKTKTMVARFRAESGPDGGVALLSFTNAAVNVARSRCLDDPGLLDSPNFVGTFDSFFHRYAVTPAMLRTTGTSPRYKISWDDLPDHLRIVRQGSGSGLRLSLWTLRSGNSYYLDESRLNHDERRYWNNLDLAEWTREQIRAKGTARISALHQRRVYDTLEARRLAIRALVNPNLGLLSTLARRFKEVIVDEFQDCDNLEHQLLDLMSGAGIRTITVADPDQAIYEFRQTTDNTYRQYVSKLDSTRIAYLSTCYRSTPAICGLVTSLRQASAASIESHEPADTQCPPVHVIVGSGAAAGAAAARVLASHDIPPAGTRFLAHKKKDARALARTRTNAIKGEAAIPKVLAAIAEVRSGADSRARHSSITRIEKVILGLFAWTDDEAPETRQGQLEELGLTNTELRILASKIVSAAPGWTSREACGTSIRAIVEDGARTANLPLVKNLGRRLAKPKTEVWSAWASRSEDVLVSEISAIKWTHVHAVKGDEFDAVIYALPSQTVDGRHVLDDWEQGVDTEARRVLYVGVSRAQRVVVLVVPPGRKDQLTAILERDDVRFAIQFAS